MSNSIIKNKYNPGEYINKRVSLDKQDRLIFISDEKSEVISASECYSENKNKYGVKIYKIFELDVLNI